jgi:glycosyltransferase involved in cell wall biosynthesis
MGGEPLRVLVVGINFAPEHTGIAPYTTQLCEHLASRGARVSVLTGFPHYPQWEVEPRYRRRMCSVERRPGLTIERLRHYVPRRQSALRRGLYELTFALNVLLRRPDERPEVVVAVVPALLSVWPASLLARRAGAPLVVWVQDMMGQASAQSGIDGGGPVAGVVKAIEARMLRRAQRVLVLNQHFEQHIQAAGVAPERIMVQPNWTHVAPPTGIDLDSVRARYGWGDGATVVLHSGNMGLKQALENVVEAGRLADERGRTDVKFVLMGDGSQRPALEARAHGISSVEILPPVPSEDYADVLAAADILLVNERATSVDMSLPSKLTSYLRAGRPVLAASPASGGTAAELLRSQGGLLIEPENPTLLLDAVTGLAHDPDRAAALAAAGRQYAHRRLSASDALARLEDTLADVVRRAVSGARNGHPRPDTDREPAA